jgi:hypothetical protein
MIPTAWNIASCNSFFNHSSAVNIRFAPTMTFSPMKYVDSLDNRRRMNSDSPLQDAAAWQDFLDNIAAWKTTLAILESQVPHSESGRRTTHLGKECPGRSGIVVYNEVPSTIV